ncbi:TetR/AcrR family transcriptional regulator [Actinomycetospora sp. CA-084318]|uniref:TetR/AcrR family transcriptional regulator n=1 Tax=Actinomycetospora sp. CA-084318 TaxID=3239892 RepID=UPI003D96AD55
MSTRPDGTRGAYGTGRDALLDAAVRVVADRGLRNLTYRAVAQEAGVTHGLVTHYFGTREELIGQALTYSLQMSTTVVSPEPGSGRLDVLVEGLGDLVASTPAVQAFQYELALEARRTPRLAPELQAVYRGYREALARELAAAGLDDERLVAVVFAAIDGLVFQQVCGVNDLPTDEVVATLRSLLALARADPDGSVTARP